MDVCICCPSTWVGHFQLVDYTCKALLAVGFTLKQAKVPFGPEEE